MPPKSLPFQNTKISHEYQKIFGIRFVKEQKLDSFFLKISNYSKNIKNFFTITNEGYV